MHQLPPPAPYSHSLLIGIAIGSIFFIRNLILTANPIAPFLSAAAPHVAGYRAPFLSDYVFDGRFLDESLGASLIAACTLSAGMLPWILIGAAICCFCSRRRREFFCRSWRFLPRGRTGRDASCASLLGLSIVVQLFLIGYFVDRGGAFSLLSATASDTEFLTKQRSSFKTVQSIDALVARRRARSRHRPQ